MRPKIAVSMLFLIKWVWVRLCLLKNRILRIGEEVVTTASSTKISYI